MIDVATLKELKPKDRFEVEGPFKGLPGARKIEFTVRAVKPGKSEHVVYVEASYMGAWIGRYELKNGKGYGEAVAFFEVQT